MCLSACVVLRVVCDLVGVGGGGEVKVESEGGVGELVCAKSNRVARCIKIWFSCMNGLGLWLLATIHCMSEAKFGSPGLQKGIKAVASHVPEMASKILWEEWEIMVDVPYGLKMSAGRHVWVWGGRSPFRRSLRWGVSGAEPPTQDIGMIKKLLF